jgi:NAD(P)-dependent dehydrogenase (short-subunit alcohol dehydrogenase family)
MGRLDVVRATRPASVVIGATGHVGSYVVPRLVRAGHEVVALSRGARDPYVSAPEWGRVTRVEVDREAEDAAGVFGERIARLGADAVVDMLCFTRESAQQLVEALRATRSLLVHCGSIWVHGPGPIWVRVEPAEPRRRVRSPTPALDHAAVDHAAVDHAAVDHAAVDHEPWRVDAEYPHQHAIAHRGVRQSTPAAGQMPVAAAGQRVQRTNDPVTEQKPPRTPRPAHAPGF